MQIYKRSGQYTTTPTNKLSDLYILRSEILQSCQNAVTNGKYVIATRNEISDKINKSYNKKIVNGTDYVTTVAAVSALYETKTNAASTYATLMITEGLQTNITANTGAITAIQQ